MQLEEVLKQLRKDANPKNVEGMLKFGVGRGAETILGVSIPHIRALAKKIKIDHALAHQLWKTKIHEARLLAGMIADPRKITKKEMDSWVNDFYCWDICDQCCMNLFDKTPFAYEKSKEWIKSEKEFVRRAGFVMMAVLAVHDKKADNSKLRQFFPLIKKYSTDERNYVRKAVNWALRQIGKRNPSLRKEAIKVAKDIQKIDSKAARWIAADAIRELKRK